MNFKTSNKEIIISSVEKSDINNVGTHALGLERGILKLSKCSHSRVWLDTACVHEDTKMSKM